VEKPKKGQRKQSHNLKQ